jgi:magnesium transporter
MRSMAMQAELNDLVTQHMRTDFACLKADQTVGEALNNLRAHPPSGRIVYFYVVDDEGCLQGVVPTRRFLLSQPEKNIREIMVQEVVSIPAHATVLDACEFFILHKLLAFPVVEARRLVGVVDVELYTHELSDIERHEGSDQLFQIIGVHLADAQPTSPVMAFRNRFPWLIANIAGGVLAAFLSGVFEPELKKAVALALFIPVVLALAESVSIQSVSLAIQLLRGAQPTFREIRTKIQTEFVTGGMLGLACAVIVSLIALVWLGQWKVVVCLLGGIFVGVTSAAVIGVAIPNGLRYFQREPQVAAGPIVLAITDMVTLLCYFTLARWVLNLP